MQEKREIEKEMKIVFYFVKFSHKIKMNQVDAETLNNCNNNVG
jgi:hypothetical protein